MREKGKQLLSESSKIVEITLLFTGDVVNEVAIGQRGSSPTVREGSLTQRPDLEPSHGRATAPLFSLHPLTDLLGAKCADPVQAKREDDSIFIAQAHVEGEVLGRDHAAFPGVADGGS